MTYTRPQVRTIGSAAELIQSNRKVAGMLDGFFGWLVFQPIAAVELDE